MRVSMDSLGFHAPRTDIRFYVGLVCGRLSRVPPVLVFGSSLKSDGRRVTLLSGVSHRWRGSKRCGGHRDWTV